MNLKEGTRRLALLFGVLGAIVGGFASYIELQPVLSQRAQHNKFEQLVASDIVRRERKNLQAEPTDWQTVPDQSAKNVMKSKHTPQIDPKTGERIAAPQIAQAAQDPWEKYAVKERSRVTSDSNDPWRVVAVEVNEGGVKSIHWTNDYSVESIETVDGETLYPTPAPSAWLYLLIVLLPLFGFFIPWGVIRAIGWVGAGFVQRPQ
jgi:hypothetical protein